MADNWDGSPQTWGASEAPSSAKLNRELRDRMDAIRACLVGDASADADMRQRSASGTLAARPAAGNAGRFYLATDRNTLYVDDGTVWRHAGGRGAYDTFTRAGPAIGTAESGHPWTVNSGTIAIVSSIAIQASVAGICTVDTGAELETARYQAAFLSDTGTASDTDFSIVMRYLDANNFLVAQLLGGTNIFRIAKYVSGFTPLATVAVTVAANTQYIMRVEIVGGSVVAFLHTGGSSTYSLVYGGPADTVTPFATASKCGLRLANATAGGDICYEFGCVPNA